MKQRLFLGSTLLFAVLMLVACGGNSKQSNSFDVGFEGLYVGQLPCADCPGIDTKITFFNDSSVAITSEYQDGDGTSLTEWGYWTVQNGLLKADMGEYSTFYYKQLSDSIISMTDSLGETLPNLAKFYELKKEIPLVGKNFEGNYVMGDTTLVGGYLQNLVIKAIDDRFVNISFNSVGAGKGCEFMSDGKITNNQIEVQLSSQHNKMQSTMTIRFTNTERNTLNVFTSEFDDRYDLMYFCGGGGSLAGDYTRR